MEWQQYFIGAAGLVSGVGLGFLMKYAFQDTFRQCYSEVNNGNYMESKVRKPSVNEDDLRNGNGDLRDKL